MGELVPFASQEYFVLLGALGFSRGLDFLSTWIATPNLILEGNPIARFLGWRFGLIVNVAVCLLVARWPLPSVAVVTTSLLVGARNLQSAWLMRTMGEMNYQSWYLTRMEETNWSLYVACLIGQSVVYVLLGLVLIYQAGEAVVPFGIGLGMIAYAAAVTGYSLLSVWRIRRRS